MNYAIIGNGIAGVAAAEAIRRIDPLGPITMIGDERGPPYCRPMISMVLEGRIGPERLPIRDNRFYDHLGITPILGRRATGIDVDQRQVLIGDRLIDYDRLLIASGADPRPIRAEGRDLGNIFFMRRRDDVQGMLAALGNVRRALVLGGGLVGFKAAYGLLRRGVATTMLIGSAYPLSMQVDARAGVMIRDALTAEGLDVRVNLEVRAFEGNGVVRRAHLSDGTTLDCDLVVIGKGVLPARTFIPADRIEIDLGVLVDAHMRTCVPEIFAAGDVAEFMDIARQTRWVNAIWPEAVQTGRTAGFNMAGRTVACPGTLSRNVIRIFDLDVMTAGLVNPPEDGTCQVLQTHDRRRNTYRKLVFRDGNLVGMAMVGQIDQGGVLAALIGSRNPVSGDPQRLLDPGFNVGRLIPPAGRLIS
jgi:nitrite reductase (NADH) large subunit